MKLKVRILPIFVLLLCGCATLSVKTYDETVSGWKSHKDVERWMVKDFSLDTERFKRFERTLPPPRTPEETFKLKSGIYIDAAIFARATLNRINPSYQAKIVVLLVPGGANHYACSFKKEGKLFIMDYGTPYPSIVGVHGPFNTLDEYKQFFEKKHPIIRRVEAIMYLR